MKKVIKRNQVIITSLAILIAVAGYLNFADVDLGFRDKEASADSSSILDQQTISAGRKDHGAFSGRLYGYGRRWGAGSVADPDDCRRDEVYGAFSAFSADDGSE